MRKLVWLLCSLDLNTLCSIDRDFHFLIRVFFEMGVGKGKGSGMLLIWGSIVITPPLPTIAPPIAYAYTPFPAGCSLGSSGSPSPGLARGKPGAASVLRANLPLRTDATCAQDTWTLGRWSATALPWQALGFAYGASSRPRLALMTPTVRPWLLGPLVRYPGLLG